MILGLDISSSITGVAVLDAGKLVHSSTVDTRNKKKFPHVNDAAALFLEKMQYIKKNYKITDVYAEERLLAFMKQKTSAKTLATLAEYNCLYCYLCEEVFGIRPTKLNASTARKLSGVSAFKDSEKDTKQWVTEAVDSMLSDFSFGLTPKGNLVAGAADRADAAVIAMAGEALCKEESLKS